MSPTGVAGPFAGDARSLGGARHAAAQSGANDGFCSAPDDDLLTVLGIAQNYAGLNAIKLLFTTAVINGVLAPPLILIVLLSTRDRRVRGTAVNPPFLNVLGWATVLVMVVAASDSSWHPV